jgi:hypothetical protein
LVGEVLVLFVPAGRRRLEKTLSAFFVFVVICGVAIEQIGEQSLTASVESLRYDLETANKNARDRLLSLDDLRNFFGIPHDGLSLHIYFLNGDHEAEQFSRSIKQGLAAMQWRDVTITPIDEDKLGSVILPSKIFVTAHPPSRAERR